MGVNAGRLPMPSQKREKLSVRLAVILGVVGGLGALALTAPRAEAALYEFTFGGEVDDLVGFVPEPWSGVELGSPVVVTYVFDSETPDLETSLDWGIYDVISFEVSVDGIALAAEWAQIEVRNFGLDTYYVFFDDLPIGEANGFLKLTDFNALDSDDLPLDIDLDDWQSAPLLSIGGTFLLRSRMETFSSRIVPAPGTLTALLMCLGFGQSHRRRKC